jgi:hypothetical protein
VAVPGGDRAAAGGLVPALLPQPHVAFGLSAGELWYQCSHMDHSAHLYLGEHWWRIVIADPLTVEPGIVNTTCGCHGCIRDGQWLVE